MGGVLDTCAIQPSSMNEGYQTLLRNLALFDECRGDDGSSEVAISQANGAAVVKGRGDSGDEGDDGVDDDDDDDDVEWLSSSNFLLWTLLPPFTSVSPLIMKSFNRFTSDSFTGLTRNSSAPSSKHLSMKIMFQPLFVTAFTLQKLMKDNDILHAYDASNSCTYLDYYSQGMIFKLHSTNPKKFR